MKIKFNLSILSFGLSFAFLMFHNVSNAQYTKITTSFGGSNYQGDLSNGFISQIRPAVSVGLTNDIYDNFRLRANLSYLQIGADDSKSPKAGIKARNLDFKSDIIELTLLGEYDLVNNEDYQFVPYVFAGPSIYHFNPYTTVKQTDIYQRNYLNSQTPFPIPNVLTVGQKVYLHDIGTEGQLINDNATKAAGGKQYSLTQINIQLGAGIRYKISDKLSIGYEISFRKLFTDYLDDVSSKNYIGRGEWDAAISAANAAKNSGRVKLLEEGEILAYRGLDSHGVPVPLGGQPRGNPTANDAYLSSQVRLNFTLISSRSEKSMSNGSLYSTKNPNGRGQLNCPKVFY